LSFLFKQPAPLKKDFPQYLTQKLWCVYYLRKFTLTPTLSLGRRGGVLK